MNLGWSANPVRMQASLVILFLALTPLAHAQEKAASQPLTLEQAVQHSAATESGIPNEHRRGRGDAG